MQFVRVARWLESVSGLAAGVLGLFVLRDLLLLRAVTLNASPSDAGASLVLVPLVADLCFLAIAVIGALVHGWMDKRVGRYLLWGGAIPLIVLVVLGGNQSGGSALGAALLVLLASAFAMLSVQLSRP